MRAGAPRGVSHVFFIDRSLGRYTVANALRAAGALVEVHDDHFAQGARDQVWLTHVGQRGWAVLTKDDRIRYRAAEIAAATNAGVALFIFVGKNVRGAAMAEAFRRALSKMGELLDTRRRPFVAKVTRTGAVAVIG